MAQNILGKTEFVVLGLLARRAHGAHGTALLEDLEELTQREWSVGALYTTLDRLEKKGFVSSQWGAPTPQRGGRRKRVYRVEAAGQAALDATHRLAEIIGTGSVPLRPAET